MNLRHLPVAAGDGMNLAIDKRTSQQLSAFAGVAFGARLALRGQGPFFDVTLEGGGEVRGDYEAYDARLSARVVF